jgi:hypothetical protein
MKLEKSCNPVLIGLFRPDRHLTHPDGFDKRGVAVRESLPKPGNQLVIARRDQQGRIGIPHEGRMIRFQSSCVAFCCMSCPAASCASAITDSAPTAANSAN